MTLWVEITGCDYETSWYFNLIGVSIEVKDRVDGYYEVIEDNPERPWERKIIDKRHAKIIE
jgi:hypothetical protein